MWLAYLLDSLENSEKGNEIHNFTNVCNYVEAPGEGGSKKDLFSIQLGCVP